MIGLLVFSRRCTPPKREACFFGSVVPSWDQRCVENQLQIKLGAYRIVERGCQASKKSDCGVFGVGQGASGELVGCLEQLWMPSGALWGPRGSFLECLGGLRVGRGEHWAGFGDSPGCLGALKESSGEHSEEPWRLYGKSWGALGRLRGPFSLSSWLKCLCFIVFCNNAPHLSGKHDFYFSLCLVESMHV